MRSFLKLGYLGLCLVVPLSSCAGEEQAIEGGPSNGSGTGSGSGSGSGGSGGSSGGSGGSKSTGTGGSTTGTGGSTGGTTGSGGKGGSAGSGGTNTAFGGAAGAGGSSGGSSGGSGGSSGGSGGSSGGSGGSGGKASCSPNCDAGEACTMDGNCTVGQCVDLECAPDHCGNDTLDDGDGETDQDCGGPCKGCQPGDMCSGDADCEFGNCDSDVCQEPDHCLFEWEGRCGDNCNDTLQSDQAECILVLNCVFENREECATYSACTSSGSAPCGNNTLQLGGAAYTVASVAATDCMCP